MKSILCYGDSNTYGLMPDSPDRYPRDVRWTGILQKKLGEDYYVIEEGLSGRTTLWDDPIEEHKNGKKYLLPCLDSHKPVDLVILMLGTNDLKTRFSLTPFDIGAPVPIHSVGRDDLDHMFFDVEERSQALAHYYEEVANRYQIEYLNPGSAIETNELDGIHYSAKGHAAMAELMEKKVREILE